VKLPLTAALVALVLSVIALAKLPNEPPPTEAVSVRPSATDAVADLAARLSELAAENRELRERLAALERRPAPSVRRQPVAGDWASKEELAELREELLAALAARGAEGSAAAADPAELEQRVASTLSKLRHAEAVEKVRSYHEERSERLEETLPKIEEWLELAPYQTEAMRTALLAQYEREAELVRRWEAGEDSELLGEQKTADREAHRADVTVFLTPAQLETYWARVSGGGE